MMNMIPNSISKKMNALCNPVSTGKQREKERARLRGSSLQEEEEHEQT